MFRRHSTERSNKRDGCPLVLPIMVGEVLGSRTAARLTNIYSAYSVGVRHGVLHLFLIFLSQRPSLRVGADGCLGIGLDFISSIADLGAFAVPFSV